MKTPALLLLSALLLLTGCEPLEQARTALQAVINDKSGPAGDHGHTHDQGGDHGHGDDDQGHADGPAELHPVTMTHFSPVTELYVEFKPLVVGEASSFAVHLSRLSDGSPVRTGTVTVSLVGGEAPPEHFSVTAPDIPGLFRPLVMPREAAWRQVIVSLADEHLSTSHHLGEFGAFPSQAAALAEMAPEEPDHDAITYTKEQQWQADFNTIRVEERTLRASILATGVLRPKADGEVYLSATSAGHIRTQGRFPYPGMRVEQGDLLATIAPQLAADSDLSTLNAAVEKARSTYDLAKHERERLEKLWREKVIALHRLHEAETALQLAKTELDAAERRYRQSTGQKQGGGSGIPILAPIDGVIADSHTAAGKYVTEGETLFHIVNLQRLWLEARVAEADIGVLQDPDGAWFTVNGFDQTFDSFRLDGRKVAFGGIIDPVSRTVPLIFEFDNPDQRLRAGMFANVRIFTGETASGPVAPASAIYDDGGQEVVYVLLDGEHFLRRPVRLGVREGDWVQVLSGVSVGERVVSHGAYLLRLASSSPTEAGHGHAH